MVESRLVILLFSKKIQVGNYLTNSTTYNNIEWIDLADLTDLTRFNIDLTDLVRFEFDHYELVFQLK